VDTDANGMLGGRLEGNAAVGVADPAVCAPVRGSPNPAVTVRITLGDCNISAPVPAMTKQMQTTKTAISVVKNLRVIVVLLLETL
jgi:hypothetical protein